MKTTKELKSLFGNFIKLRYPIENLSRYKKLKFFVNHTMPLSGNRLISDNYKEALDFLGEKYSTIIVGSDEVWRLRLKFPSIYWLSPSLSCKKITLAASANGLEYAKLAPKTKKYMKECLNTFEFIGVRDNHTLELMQELKIPPGIVHKVPDPIFSFDFSENIYETVRQKLIQKGLDLEKPIMAFVISGYGEREKICQPVYSFFKEQDYQIVNISMNNNFSDFCLIGCFDPLEWAHAFKFFNFCFTDRFHATMFCLKNNTPFLSVDHKKEFLGIKSKTYDFLEEINFLDH